MRRLALLLTCLLILISVASSTIFFISYFGYQDLVQARERLLRGELKEAGDFSSSANFKFRLLTTTFQFLNPIEIFLPVGEQINKIETLLDGAKDISEGLSRAISSYERLSNATFLLISGKPYEENIFSEETLALGIAKEKLSFGKTKISGANTRFFFMREDNLEKMEEELAEGILLMEKLEGVIEVLPKIIPQNGKKNYLVLLQNNLELRPTGGFIGSFAILAFDGGKITEFRILDVYDADGQLKGHVEPPMPIRKYLGQVNWFLRDSNFDPDFRESSEQAAWFLEKEMGIKVDGVLAIDVQLAQNLLEIVGEVKLIDYGETVNAENVFLKANKYAQDNFFPGSKQKKNFLGSLTKTIIEKLGQSNNKTEVARILYESMEEKHLQFSFFDPSIQIVFAVNNWDGALVDLRRKNENTLNDFVAIREANLGVNKVNFFVKRVVEQEINITEKGTFEHKLTITYNNESSDQEFGGKYKNYLRVYVPKAASIIRISIDGKKMEIIAAETNPVVYERKAFEQSLRGRLEVETSTAEQFLMIGFLVEIPPQSQKTIIITYSQPMPPSRDFIYSLLVSKQPGTNSDPYILSINYPLSFVATTNNPSALIQEGRIAFPSRLTKDQALEIQFLRRE